MVALQILAVVAGIYLVIYTFLSATRTFVLPRSAPVQLSRVVFRTVRICFDFVAQRMPTYEQRDNLMALYAPISLLILVPTWLILTALGYAFIFWGLGITPFWNAILFSGSSILTLGFATADTQLQTILAFSEATVGLILVAMLISYLPTMYSAFSKRETAVSLLEVRAGSPPTAAELVWRIHALNEITETRAFWQEWERWFVEIDESHTSLAALVFFRSPQSYQSWVNAAGAVLDGAALMQTAVDRPMTPYPTLVIRAGNVALRHIADFFRVPYNPDPHFPADPISITRAEFDRACDRLAAQGVPIKEDRDHAWVNFAGWRVNYDSVLNAMAELTMAPETKWVSDYTFVPVDPSTGQTGGSLQQVD